MASSSNSLPTSPATTCVEYDVFLNFRGPDTRPNFTDCLYTALTGARISVFRDTEELTVGENINSEILEKIRRSTISIPIFSENYASSKSCLMEVAEMAECRRRAGQVIMPIFYDVPPWVVRHQGGTFERDFREHERKGIDPETIHTWKQALSDVGDLKGWELAKIDNGHYSKVIQLVVSHVEIVLKKVQLVIPEYLVGINDHAKHLMRELDMASTDVRIIVIHGIAGIGKTTLAKFMYNQICNSFDGCCFLENVREACRQSNGLRCLQRQLVSDLLKRRSEEFSTRDEGIQFIKHRFGSTKVLILLDDVDDCEHVKALVGEGNWFGQGSRIIITTKRGDILNIPATVLKYEVEWMKESEAQKLFNWHAFGSNIPEEGYHEFSRDIVSLIGGLPLALEVIASGLFRKAKEIWIDTIKKLRETPDPTLVEKLKISYEYLDVSQKEIFLDIACFLIGKDQRFAFYMWEGCNLYPFIGINSLLLLSLVKIGDSGELWMHNQLRDLGREIVRRENPERPRKRSRLWDHTDAFRTLKKMKRSNKVVGLSLTFEDDLDNCFTGMEFSCLPNLRFLRLDQAATEERFEHRLSSLRWLDWEGCSKIDDVLDMHLENLVVLDLSSSKVNQDRDSWSKLMKMAKELKVLNLQGCANLRGSPSFPTEMTLKILILEGCYRLMRVDPSISNLKGLKSLNLKFCIEVKQLPEGLCFMKELKELLLDGTSIRRIHFPKGSMEQLEVLSACGCKNLTLITDSIGNLKSLTHLALDDAIIGKLPSSIGSLERLQSLSLRNCYNILQLPPSVGDLKSLMEIDLSNTKIAELPPSFNNLKNLKVLKMEGCFLREFPGALSHLSKMEEIDFSLCRSLSGDISIDITALPVLRILRLSHTEISSLTATIAGLSDLEVLDLLECKKLQMLPMLPSSLSSLRVGSEMLREVPDLSTLTNLKELHLQFDPAVASCEVLNTFGWILSLSKLETLEVYLSNLTELRLPPGFVSLSQLRKLTFSRVDLQYLLYFPSSLSTLSLQHCRSLTKAPDFSNLNGLSELELLHCKMAEIHGLEHLKALQDLKLSHCCVKGLGGLNRLSNLRNLTLFNCEFLEILPDISHLKMLREPEIEFCRFACDDKDPRHYGVHLTYHWHAT
ncbi:hypothetical protein CRG98_041437 [Punica granatum]|uniref:TIR domain-containing protein n=1 Tax=Punica granatum TaxID=22663 RepID=A0A2I0I2F6_PUNGR|nr:hypothetical protein CRG98_041437 [Punica granatum]